MSSKSKRISLVDKILSIISLYTVGIFGIIWLIITFFTKKKVSDFLKYNIFQSIIIGIFLYIVSNIIKLTINIGKSNQILHFLTDFTNNFFVIKTIRLYQLGISLTYFELILYIILFYISLGIILGKILYLPIISDITKSFQKQNN